MNSQTRWKETILKELEIRDTREKQFDEFIAAFEESAKRVIEVDKKEVDISSGEVEKELARLYSQLSLTQDDYKAADIDRQKYKKNALELGQKLFEEQRRVKKYKEETDVKTAAVQHLQDEILALQIQLNVAEGKMKEVQKENEALVERWMAKVAGEAEKLNDANAFLESLKRIRRTQEK